MSETNIVVWDSNTDKILDIIEPNIEYSEANFPIFQIENTHEILTQRRNSKESPANQRLMREHF